MTSDDDLRARVALACLTEPGSRDMWRLVAADGPVAALTRVRAGAVPDRLAAVIAPRLRAGDPADLAAAALDRTERLGARVVTPGDEEWPAAVDDLRLISEDSADRLHRDVLPPLCLWVRGPARLGDLSRRSVAVVGARASTPYGDHIAADLAYGLSERHWTVVSGGAYGIDAQAHRGALTCGWPTVAVLACGVDQAYPVAHTAMFERIVETGLLISEWPPGARPHRQRFLIRNRLIAALTRGTVVVEASARSGARQTAGRAMRLGRPTMAVPGSIMSAASSGAHQLLRMAGTRLVTSVAEIIEEVGGIGDDLAPLVRGADQPHDQLDPSIAQVLDGVPARAGLGPEEIAAASGVPLRTALRALPLLRDTGFVVEDATGWRLAPRRRAP